MSGGEGGSADGGLAALAGRLWAARDPEQALGAAARELRPGAATDWGLPADAGREAIRLAGGVPDPAALPRAALLGALRRTLGDADPAALTYGGALGGEALRERLAERSRRELGLPAAADGFMLTNGSAGAIAIVCAALLDPGDIVVTESPTFAGSLRTLRGARAEIVPVPVDGDGCRTDLLAGALARVEARGRRAKLIYVIPNFHNPTGATLAAERRRELVRLAAEHGALLLEDDAYGDIHFGAERPPSLAALAGGAGVVVAGTFSKTIATGLRVGWIQAAPALIERFVRVRFDMGGSPLLHAMIAGFMAGGDYDAHVGRMRALYARKAGALRRALADRAEPYLGFRAPEGGFFLWVRLREGLDAEAVRLAALDEGVVFPSGRVFYPDGAAPGPEAGGGHVRLAFSTASEAALEEAADRIARACARVAEAGGR